MKRFIILSIVIFHYCGFITNDQLVRKLNTEPIRESNNKTWFNNPELFAHYGENLRKIKEFYVSDLNDFNSCEKTLEIIYKLGDSKDLFKGYLKTKSEIITNYHESSECSRIRR